MGRCRFELQLSIAQVVRVELKLVVASGGGVSPDGRMLHVEHF